MASSMRLIASNLLTRSGLRSHPALAIAASESTNRRQFSENIRPPSSHYSTNFSRPKVDLRSQVLFNGIFVRSYSSTPEPIRSSVSWSFTNHERCFEFNYPGLKKTESDESVCVFLNMPEVQKMEDIKLYRVPKRTTDMLVIEGRTYNVCQYIGIMRLPKNVDRTGSGIKGEMKDGLFMLTLPKAKVNHIEHQKKANVFVNAISSFMFKLSLGFCSSIPSVVMLFARSYIIKICCPGTFDSFSMYKEETAESVYVRYAPGVDKCENTREGVCVSLNMPGLKMDDVKACFKPEAFFIEGKAKTETNKVHYVTGIRLPESVFEFCKAIKTQMRDGTYKAFFPGIETLNTTN